MNNQGYLKPARGGDATDYVEKRGRRWYVTYEDAPIGILGDV
jgi:hypothetical protein